VSTDRDLETKRRAAAHPDRPGEKCNAERGTYAPKVNRSHCEGKKECVVVCPNDVFEVRRIDQADFLRLSPLGMLRVAAHRGMTAYTPNADQCAACGLCVVACPEGAIELVRVR
jgi:NAD-dependent dihydropyrimidine dehydrogenase PreA subunit